PCVTSELLRYTAVLTEVWQYPSPTSTGCVSGRTPAAPCAQSATGNPPIPQTININTIKNESVLLIIGMVFGEFFTTPRLFRGPCLRSICPERMVGGQAQGQECQGSHVK